MNDQQLLLRYVRQGSQAAFSEIVARHLNFVYTICRRETGDAALAEDVTQVVFLLLARKAASLRVETTLSGWLFQTARFAAKNARRREASRKKQEQTMEEHFSQKEPPENEWDQIEPHYNAALAALSAKDREAVLLRFAGGLSFPELGAALGTSEDAARMRLNRAVSRLRQSFAQAGPTVSVAVLAGLLAERTAEAAPSACAGKIVGGAAKISPQVHFQLQGVLKAMALNKLKVTAITGLSLALAGAFSFVTLAQTATAPTVTQQTVQGAAPQRAAQGEIDPDAAAVLRQSAEATAALHSLSADVEQHSVVEQDAVVPPRPWGLLANLTLKRPAQVLSETPGINGQTSFVNGKDFWFYRHWNKQYQREADLDLNTSRIGPPVFSTFFFNPGFQGLRFAGLTDRPQETRTRLLGTLPWHGGTYTAVQITQPTGHGELSMVGTLTAYFGTDHLLHGFAIDVMYRGKRTFTEYALKNIRLNPDVPDTNFVFVPPAGAQPTDPPVAGLRFDK